MAILFLQKKKIGYLLIPILGAVIFAAAAVVWWVFFTTGTPLKDDAFLSTRSVEVDTSILSHPFLLELDEPRAKTQIPSEVGRKNPLLPSLQ